MGESTDDPDDGEIMEAAVTTLIASIHTSMPARILSYKHGPKPRATVQPVVRFSSLDPDSGDRITKLSESVANVPVFFGFGGGGDFSDTWPLKAGDPVFLLIAERSLDEWLATNSGDNAPQDPRRFDVTDAVALPVFGAGELPADAFDAVARVIKAPLTKVGSASASDFVALSSLVEGNNTDILAELVAIGVAIGAIGGAYTPTWIPGSVGATKLQAE